MDYCSAWSIARSWDTAKKKKRYSPEEKKKWPLPPFLLPLYPVIQQKLLIQMCTLYPCWIWVESFWVKSVLACILYPVPFPDLSEKLLTQMCPWPVPGTPGRFEWKTFDSNLPVSPRKLLECKKLHWKLRTHWLTLARVNNATPPKMWMPVVSQITESPGQLNFYGFSPHAFHLDKKVEVFATEGSPNHEVTNSS